MQHNKSWCFLFDVFFIIINTPLLKYYNTVFIINVSAFRVKNILSGFRFDAIGVSVRGRRQLPRQLQLFFVILYVSAMGFVFFFREKFGDGVLVLHSSNAE